MPGLCNFGENEIPQASPCTVELKADTRGEFDWRVRFIEAQIRDMSEFDPAFQKKIDILCREHSLEELENAVSDLKWEQHGVERKCWNDGMTPADQSRLETLISRIVALQSAIKRKEMRDEQH